MTWAFSADLDDLELIDAISGRNVYWDMVVLQSLSNYTALTARSNTVKTTYSEMNVGKALAGQAHGAGCAFSTGGVLIMSYKCMNRGLSDVHSSHKWKLFHVCFA